MKKYFVRLNGQGLFVRVPRWIYNRWPTGGLVEISEEKTPLRGTKKMTRTDWNKAIKRGGLNKRNG